MITRARFTRLFVVGLLPFSGIACIVTNGHSWWGPTAWTESVTEEFPLDTATLQALEVRTHNGSITFEDQPAETAQAVVIVTKKAGGRTMSDAQAALEAIDVYVDPARNETQRIGWKWRGLKHRAWGARVSFDIKAPGNLRFDGQTHNGPITIKGVTSGVRVRTHNGPVNGKSIGGGLSAQTHNGPIEIDGITGDARVVTHNGPVTIESAGGKLYAKSHNGRIVAAYTGDDITVRTHNGSVSADLQRCAALNGKINTHNGGVKVVVGQETSANLTCRTHNGSINCDIPLEDRERSKRMLTGTIGQGAVGELDIKTHNGSVRIKKAAG